MGEAMVSKSNSEYLVRIHVHSALYPCSRQKVRKMCNLFLAWQHPHIEGFWKLSSNLFQVHSWMTYGSKNVRFWWNFHILDINAKGVLLMNWLSPSRQTSLEVVFFMNALENTNNAGILSFKGHTCFSEDDRWLLVISVGCQWWTLDPVNVYDQEILIWDLNPHSKFRTKLWHTKIHRNSR